METDLEFVEGMQFDRGYISPYFVTDRDRMEAVLEDPYILITDKKISAMHDLLPLLEKIVQSGKPLLDHRRGRRRRGPGHAGRQQAARHLQRRAPSRPPASATAARPCCEDIAILTGGQVISEELGLKLENTELSMLGRAKQVNVDKDNTTIIEGAGKQEAIKGRIEQIKAQIEDTTSDYDREKLQERLAKLSGGVAVINVGAATEIELKEKKHRVEDALSATRAAVEEGIVPGGGVALAAALAGPGQGRQARRATRRPACSIVRRALEEPLRQIAENAGHRGLDRRRRRQEREEGPSASTPPTAIRGPWSRPGSSTPPRSPAPRCRTPPRSRGCS